MKTVRDVIAHLSTYPQDQRMLFEHVADPDRFYAPEYGYIQGGPDGAVVLNIVTYDPERTPA